MTELEALKIVRDRVESKGPGSNPKVKEAVEIVDALIERVEALENDPEGKVEMAKSVLAGVDMLIADYLPLHVHSRDPNLKPTLLQEFYRQVKIHQNWLPKEYFDWRATVLKAAIKEYLKTSDKETKSHDADGRNTK